jgi:uncharacterized protein
MRHYRAPVWLPGGHLQTIWGSRCSRTHFIPAFEPQFERERWDTPDGDFIDVDFLSPHKTSASQTGLVMFHGLEGDSSSAYSQAFATLAQSRGWTLAIPHFRGCSGEINRAPRAYHSGDYEEIDWILQRLQERHRHPWLAVGISLGGNALLRWAQERGASASETVTAVAAICSPLDLMASGQALGSGFNRWVYARMFLQTMKRKARQKWAQFPGLFDLAAAQQARTLAEFDDVFTAPLHGFKNTADYWKRASSKPHLPKMQLPTLVLNAKNDPFIPAHSLPQAHEVSSWVTLWQPQQGGHVGFPQTQGLGSHVLAMPQAVLDWFESMGVSHG